ncbi:ABC-2 family transporter protein [Gottschalkia purinilytica]|uniref:ABC-2 family transporter protein n=1 Tax=Gottschalkia purinilytica TaxID=1503 RepID=A0A0L0W9Z2_GOTPU|nr:ABC transporter permease [Gottschalkia purinilytica]KNF08276.1 ABC-2 family transporter protein [Gottschalkia purinilytica]
MINLIYSEILKLKRLHLTILLVITAMLNTIFLSDGMGIFYGQSIKLEKYLYQVEFISFALIFSLLFINICSYIFSREFTDGTVNTLYTYPFSKYKVFVGKIITMSLIISIVYIVQFIIMFILIALFSNDTITKEILRYHINVNLFSLIFQIVLIPISAFLGLVSKNLVIPFIYSIIVSVLNIYLQVKLPENLIYYIPTLFPTLNVLKTEALHNNVLSNIISGIFPIYTLIIAIFTFILSMTMCLIYLHNSDTY